MAMKLYASCAAMVVVQLSYGGANILVKIALEQNLNPLVFIVYRHIIAFLVLAPSAYVLERKRCRGLTVRTVMMIFLLALMGSTAHLNLFYGGIKYTSPTVASAFSNIIPSFTFVLALLFGMEKLEMKRARGVAKVVGAVTCVGGSLIFTFWKGRYITNNAFVEKPLIEDLYASPQLSANQNWVKGSSLILLSDLAWSVWLILQAVVARTYSAQLTMNVMICLFASLQSGFLAVFLARSPDLWKLQWDLRLLTIFYTGIMNSAIGYYLQSWCISHNGPVFASMFSPLVLVFVAIFSAFAFAERLHIGSLVGAVFIILGLYLVLWGKKADHTTDDAEEQENGKGFIDNKISEMEERRDVDKN